MYFDLHVTKRNGESFRTGTVGKFLEEQVSMWSQVGTVERIEPLGEDAAFNPLLILDRMQVLVIQRATEDYLKAVKRELKKNPSLAGGPQQLAAEKTLAQAEAYWKLFRD